MDLVSRLRAPFERCAYDGILSNAHLFVDDGAATAIQSIGGLEYLLGLGVVNVSSLQEKKARYEVTGDCCQDVAEDLSHLNSLLGIRKEKERTEEKPVKLIFLVTVHLDVVKLNIVEAVKRANAKWAKVYILNTFSSAALDALQSNKSGATVDKTSFDVTGYQMDIQQMSLPESTAEVTIVPFELYAAVHLCNSNSSKSPNFNDELPSISVFTVTSEALIDIFPVTLSRLSLKPGETTVKHVSGLDANYHLPTAYRSQLKHLGHTISSFCKQLEVNVSNHCFSCGFTSKLVGNLVANEMAKTQSKGDEKASLIIIDRTLDMVSPLLYDDVPLMQVVSNSFMQHSTHERKDDKEDSFESQLVKKLGKISLLHSSNVGAGSLLSSVYYDQEKESVENILTRWEEIFELPDATNTHVEDPETKLLNLIDSFCKNDKITAEEGWIARIAECQIIAAIALALKSRRDSKSDPYGMNPLERNKYEKDILSACDGTNLLTLINILVRSRDRKRDITNVIILALVAFSLVGLDPGFDSELRIHFREYLNEVLGELKEVPQALGDILSISNDSFNNSGFLLDRIMSVLEEVGQARKELFTKEEANQNTRDLKIHKEGESDALNSGNSYMPLLTRIAAQITNSGKFPEMHVHRCGETFSVEQTAMSFLKTGFNVLGLSSGNDGKGPANKSSMYNETLIVFVIGGISANEVRDMHDFFEEQAFEGNATLPKNVFLGGTGITSQEAILRTIFEVNNGANDAENKQLGKSQYANLFG